MAGAASCEYPLIQAVTITCPLSVKPYNGRGELRFGNTNRLLHSAACEIQLSKTCYINETGCCITMQAEIAAPPTIVLLNSFGKLTPMSDSNRICKWIQAGIDG